jgi:pimeloyl-ACP methyl ester carboxylesterase/class 3 adenylate cyclase
MNQHIRFCKSFDGSRIAYAVTGAGPPLVKAQHWLTHLEYEFESPLWKPWIEALSKDNTLLRMDQRACGLSDWDLPDISFEVWVRDLEAVVDAAGFDRFALFGHSQGAAIGIEYAVRHPERVTHLVILGGYARGWMKRGLPPERMAELEAQLKLVENGWGRDDASYRQMFAMQFIPGATLEQINSLSDLQRAASSPENTVRIIRAFFMIDVRASAPRVECPTLLLHGRGDRRVPFEEGRILASLIPGARLVPLETENHILLAHEPAFRHFFEELHAFVPRATGSEDGQGRAADVEDEQSARLPRKLAAIFSADVKGYSRLMEENEEATVRALTALRKEAFARIREHGAASWIHRVTTCSVNFAARSRRCGAPPNCSSTSRRATNRSQRAGAWSFASGSTWEMLSWTVTASTATASTSPRVSKDWRKREGCSFRKACGLPSAADCHSPMNSAASTSSRTSPSPSAPIGCACSTGWWSKG